MKGIERFKNNTWKHILLIMLYIQIVSCGFNGEQKLTLTQQGTSTTVTTITFGFIDQIKDLCVMDTMRSLYATDELYNKAVADCVFAKTQSINTQALCSQPGLTPEQQATCKGLNP